MAIAWLHREDYERAGILNLAVLDPGGILCSQQATLHSIILLPVSLTWYGPQLSTAYAGRTTGMWEERYISPGSLREGPKKFLISG